MRIHDGLATRSYSCGDIHVVGGGGGVGVGDGGGGGGGVVVVVVGGGLGGWRCGGGCALTQLLS